MAILAECPTCKLKQSVKNKVCKCGENLDKAKRSNRVQYWIDYKIPGGKVRRELIGYSIDDARAADGKRKVQKKENRIFDMLPESKMSFKELSEWYLNLSSVKKLSSYKRIQSSFKFFIAKLGGQIVNTITLADLDNYREERLDGGLAPGTIDVEMSIIKGMVSRAFDNDKIDGRVMKAFRKLKNKIKRGGNARKRTISVEEYIKLLSAAPEYIKNFLTVAYNTGMRPGELRNLKWKHINLKSGFIMLPADFTKEKNEKKIPINHHVRDVLIALRPVLKPVTEEYHDFVFTRRFGKPIRGAGGIKYILKKTCEKAKIPYGHKEINGIIMHDFRRSFKTNMLYAEVDKVHRDLILGHRLQGMDIHYMAPSDETLKKAMDKFTRWLDDQTANLDKTLTKQKIS